MPTGKRRRTGSVVTLVGLIVMVGIPSWLTWREVQRAKASAALIAAIERKDTPAALAALDVGADANAREGEKPASFSQILRDFWNRMRGRKPAATTGPTALLLATTPDRRNDGDMAQPCDVRLVKALLDKGADCNVHDDFGFTPLITASLRGPAEAVRLLCVHGANVNAQTRPGRTVLIYTGNAKTVNILLDAGADVNVADKRGITALMTAAISGDVEKAKALLQHGAKIDARDIDDEDAKRLAIRTNHFKIVALLKKAGAK